MLTKYEELCTPTIPFLSVIYERPKEMLQSGDFNWRGYRSFILFFCIIYSFFFLQISCLNVYFFKKKKYHKWPKAMHVNCLVMYEVLDHWRFRRWCSLFILGPLAARLLLPGMLFQTPSVVWHILWSLSLSAVLQMLLLLPRKLSLPVPGSWLLLFYEPKWPLLWEFPSCRGAGRSPLTPPTLFALLIQHFLPSCISVLHICLLKDISPEYSLEGRMLKLQLQYSGHLMARADSLEKTLSLERLKVGGEGGDRGWDG